MKKVVILLALLAPVFAQAENVKETCITNDQAQEVVSLDVQYSFEGSFDEMASKIEVPVTAKVRMNMHLELGPSKIIEMNGTGVYSAKGPFFELSSADGKSSLFISAVASGSPSEFVFNGKKFEVFCD